MSHADYLAATEKAAMVNPRPSTMLRNHDEISMRLGEVLKHGAIEHARATKQKLPLWDVFIDERYNPETGETEHTMTSDTLDLYRVHSLTKTFSVEGSEETQTKPNPNFGRFYMALRAPLMMDGRQLRDTQGRLQTSLRGFKWFDQSLFVRSGALDAVAPKLVNLLLHQNGAPELTEKESKEELDYQRSVVGMYPKELIKGLMNTSPAELLKGWQFTDKE